MDTKTVPSVANVQSSNTDSVQTTRTAVIAGKEEGNNTRVYTWLQYSSAVCTAYLPRLRSLSSDSVVTASFPSIVRKPSNLFTQSTIGLRPWPIKCAASTMLPIARVYCPITKRSTSQLSIFKRWSDQDFIDESIQQIHRIGSAKMSWMQECGHFRYQQIPEHFRCHQNKHTCRTETEHRSHVATTYQLLEP